MVIWAPKAFLSPALPFTAYRLSWSFNPAFSHSCCCLLLSLHGPGISCWLGCPWAAPSSLASGAFFGDSALTTWYQQSLSIMPSILGSPLQLRLYLWREWLIASPGIFLGTLALVYRPFYSMTFSCLNLTHCQVWLSAWDTALAYSGPQLLTPRKFSR